MGDQSHGFASRKDKAEDDYEYPEKESMERRDFADDVFDYGDDYIYDYQDYYVNNLKDVKDYEQYDRNRNADFMYPIYVENEGSEDKETSNGLSEKKMIKKKVTDDARMLLTTLPPITLDFKFTKERLKVLESQEEMFDRIMEYSSQI